MDHDTLVKFAAGKVDGGARDGLVCWEEVGEGGCTVLEVARLSSPDLMLKGMGVAIKEGMEPFFERDRVGFLDTHDQYGGVLLDKKVEEIGKMPERFWQCYAEVEYESRPYAKEELDEAKREAKELGKKIGWE